MPSEGAATCHPFCTLDFQTFDPTFVLSLLQTLYCGGSRFVSTVEHVFEDLPIGRPTREYVEPLDVVRGKMLHLQG